MKIKSLIIITLSVFTLAACGQQIDTEPSEETSPAPTMEESEDIGGDFLGSWTRTAVYLNGALENTVPANLTFNADGTYNSSGMGCNTSGTYEGIEEGTITMVMIQNSCPGNIPLPLTVTYTYTIEEDEDGVEQMTTVTGPQMETYVR